MLDRSNSNGAQSEAAEPPVEEPAPE
jgi:hypothetical protein